MALSSSVLRRPDPELSLSSNVDQNPNKSLPTPPSHHLHNSSNISSPVAPTDPTLVLQVPPMPSNPPSCINPNTSNTSSSVPPTSTTLGPYVRPASLTPPNGSPASGNPSSSNSSTSTAPTNTTFAPHVLPLSSTPPGGFSSSRNFSTLPTNTTPVTHIPAGSSPLPSGPPVSRNHSTLSTSGGNPKAASEDNEIVKRTDKFLAFNVGILGALFAVGESQNSTPERYIAIVSSVFGFVALFIGSLLGSSREGRGILYAGFYGTVLAVLAMAAMLVHGIIKVVIWLSAAPVLIALVYRIRKIEAS